jgi:hypothetical protein
MIAAFSDVDTQASRLRGFWIVPARSNLVRACGGETRGGPLAAVALVAAPVLVPEAAVRGVCWRDQGCGPSTISRTSRAANIFFMLFSLGISGGSACLSQPPVPWH